MTNQEQLRLGAGSKFKTIEAKQKVTIAEVSASALKATADGQAYANPTVASAQADALRLQRSRKTRLCSSCAASSWKKSGQRNGTGMARCHIQFTRARRFPSRMSGIGGENVV
jgi:hypothetical protein